MRVPFRDVSVMHQRALVLSTPYQTHGPDNIVRRSRWVGVFDNPESSALSNWVGAKPSAQPPSRQTVALENSGVINSPLQRWFGRLSGSTR